MALCYFCKVFILLGVIMVLLSKQCFIFNRLKETD